MAVQAEAWEFEQSTMPVVGVEAAYGYFIDGATPGIHRGLPSRYLTFIVSLDDPVEVAESEEDLSSGRRTAFDVIVAGLHTHPAYVRQPPRQRGVQLAVHPLVARRLFGTPAAELDGLGFEGRDVLGRAVTELHERMHELMSWQERFDVLGAYLARRADDSEQAEDVRAELAQAWHVLERSRGRVPIRVLAASVGFSERQLAKLFGQEFGVSPKSLARIMRFDHAIALIGQTARSGHTPSFADIAARSGFYDQSHLVTDFQQFAGTTPSQWLREEFRNLQAGGHSSGEY